MAKLYRWGCWWVVWLLCAAAPVFAAPASAPVSETPATLLTDGAASVNVVGGVDYLIEDAGQPLSGEQVRSLELASRWTRYEGRHINLVIQKKPVWFRFEVRNRSQRSEWLLNLNAPLLEDVAFVQVDAASDRASPVQRAGIKVPAGEMLLKYPEPVFRLVLAPGERATVLLRVHTESSFAAPITLWAPHAFEAHRFDTGITMGLLFGILAVMLLYNASLFAFTLDRSYFFYSLYLLSIVLYELAVTGVGPLYVWPGNAWMLTHGYEFFASCAFLTATVFFRQFLELKSCPIAHIRHINTALVVFWVVATVMTITMRSEQLFYLIGLIGLLGGFVAIYVSIVLIALGVASARYFAIAWSALVFGTMLTLLMLYGAIEVNWLSINAQHIGFVIETVLLSIALADRIRRERQQRELAQREALGLTLAVQREREEKIKAQAEVIDTETRAKVELELRVIDRTAELGKAMNDLAQANVELSRLSVTDALTGVHNRRYFDSVLAREHERSLRTGVSLALLLCDLDHFKNINDRFGHLVGDDCLRRVAAVLRQVVGRSSDLIARYGGEEFALVLPGNTPEQAAEVAERVRAAVVAMDFRCREEHVPLTMSVGVVAQAAMAGSSVADFIAAADAALYRAKKNGRNRVEMAG
jgi:two-component system, sensor histidine kinase LadS